MTLALDLVRALDPVALAREVGMTPDEWQIDALRAPSDRLLLNCCRQAGKSTVAALLAVHTAVYEPGSLVLLLSPGQRQSQELYRKALNVYRTIGRPVAAEAENALSLTLESGSRIISLPGTEATIRGYSGVRLLVVDEAARVPDELYASVRPMLAVSGGRLMAMSTPFGQRGWWHSAWQEEPGWKKVLIPASRVPRISPTFLEEERRALGDWLFRQEYECQFVDTVEQLFTTEQVGRAFSPDVRPLFEIASAEVRATP